ncbi:MAG: hypothetical protein IKY45_01050 [Clostridia bacterium]|nr:hypothetical protein [Clostridia bacterium]
MRTEKEILDVLVVLKEKLKFDEEYIINNSIFPDPITDSSAKILALCWVLGVEDDIYKFGESIELFNLELKIQNLLQELVKKG